MSSKKIVMLLIFILLVFPSIYIFGEEIDTTRNGSISINYKYDNNALQNVNIKIYKIANISQNGEYTYLNSFQEQEHHRQSPRWRALH